MIGEKIVVEKLQNVIHTLLKRGSYRFYNYQKFINMPDGSLWTVTIEMVRRGDN